MSFIGIQERSPLHYAAWFNKTECLAELIRLGADVNQTDIYGQAPLHATGAYGWVESLEMLIDAGADVNIVTKNGLTPLKDSITYGNEDCAKLLRAAGATVEQKELHSMTMEDFKKNEKVKGETLIFADTENQEKVVNGLKSVDKGLPWEVQSLDSASAQLFMNLLAEESYELYDTRYMLVGEKGVGKTTIADFLVGKFPNSNRQSTDGISLYNALAFLDRKTKVWVSGVQGFTLDQLLASRLLKENPLKGQKRKRTVSLENVSTSDQQRTDVGGAEHVEITKNSLGNSTLKNNSTDNTTIYQNKSGHFQNENDCREGNISVSITHEILLEKSWAAGELKIHHNNLVPVLIWDLGGQDIFNATHPTFLTFRAIYMIVLNGSIFLDDPVKEFERLPGMSQNRTSRDYLKFWVKTILTYNKRHGNGFPKLLFVATHKDKVMKDSVEKVRTILYDDIDSMFADSRLSQHLVTKHRLFVNALDPCDQEMQKLKNILAEMSFMQPTWGEKMPTCFLPLEMELSSIVANVVKIITYDYLCKINEAMPIRPLKKEELNLFLSVQHALGKLMYFPLPNLNEKIILAPTHLIDAFRSIVTDRQFCTTENARLKFWDQMAIDGVLQKSTLEQIWQKPEFKLFWSDKEFLISL